MTYRKNFRNYYTLNQAFHTLGVRLYGPEWTGNELSAERAEDPAPVLEPRKLLEAELEDIGWQISKKQREHKDVLGRANIDRVQGELDELGAKRDKASTKLHELGIDPKGLVSEFNLWERFDKTQDILIHALRNEKMMVFELSGKGINSDLWQEMPKGFSYDLRRSLIYRSSNHKGEMIDTGYIGEAKFEQWLETIIPIVVYEGAEVSAEQKAQTRLKELVMNWDGKTKRDQFKEILQSEFKGLGERAFKRIWDKEAIKKMTDPGPKKAG